jgi:leukotriene-A4 hydrolase
MADPNSLSNLHLIITKHISLNVEANFQTKELSGHVELTAEVVGDGVSEFVADSRDLKIGKVYVDNVEISNHVVDAPHAVFGSAVRVPLGSSLSKGTKKVIKIEYTTSPDSSAIQWLAPSQTAGKEHPYLFTQCQAIHARSMLPCQDAPSVKTTYSAAITVPEALTAVMSAVPVGEPTSQGGKRTFFFEQKIPTSSYLIALAVGAIESREIGPRTKVWSEKSMVDAGAFEFSETEQFLKVAEDLMGPYVWGRYDILLLPPSFPYGGMENPCLTFVTPTLLAGDRSNADVVAHEISHSWTGNLVTNKTWEHFWLNEGFTVYAERKIYGKMHGEKARHFHAIIGYRSLQESVNQFGAENPLTNLVPNLQGIDPDDAFSSVPYEKGFNFLFYLECLVGLENFEKFFKDYIQQHKFQCLTSQDFKAYFLGYFSNVPAISQIDWDSWFNKPGMPIVEPKFDTTLSTASQDLAQKWISGGSGSADDIKNWTASQIVCFLDKLVSAAQPLPIETLKAIDSLYNLTASKNSEIRFRWYQACVRSEYEEIFPHAVSFLTEQGRMKFVRPLYRSLFKSQKGKELAVKTFVANRGMYHNIAAKMVAKDLELQ